MVTKKTYSNLNYEKHRQSRKQVAIGRESEIRLSPGLYGGPDKTKEEDTPSYNEQV